MAFVAIANACQVTIKLLWGGSYCYSCLGFYRSDGWDVTKLQTIADLVADWWYTGLRTASTNVLSLVEVYARDLTSESAPTYTSLYHAGAAGTGGTNVKVPQNVAFCVSFRTALRGRANRGRNYVPVTSYNYFDSPGKVSSATAAGWVGHYQKLLAGGSYDPTPAVWCVLSRQLNGVIQGRAVPIQAVVAADLNLDSQRRRLPGRGL
jgi:hypothetical protein